MDVYAVEGYFFIVFTVCFIKTGQYIVVVLADFAEDHITFLTTLGRNANSQGSHTFYINCIKSEKAVRSSIKVYKTIFISIVSV